MQQLRHLALVVACTAGKSAVPSHDLYVRNHRPSTGRADSWIRAVEQAEQTTRLRDLYRGQQWQSSLALEAAAAASGYTVTLYVASAGLGLRPADERAPSYSATFTTGVDSVASDASGARRWWGALAARDGATTLHDVASGSDQILAVMSPVYARVLLPEILALPRETTAVVSSAVMLEGGYTSSGLRSQLGGSALTLNQRAAAALLHLAQQDPLGSARVRDRWAAWTRERREPEAPDGQRLEDETVRDFIRLQTSETPTSRTRLLRELRAAGWACEQTRFAQIYNSVIRETA